MSDYLSPNFFFHKRSANRYGAIANYGLRHHGNRPGTTLLASGDQQHAPDPSHDRA